MPLEHCNYFTLATVRLKSPKTPLFVQQFCFGWHQMKHQRLSYCPFVRGINWWPMGSHHKVQVTLKAFPYYDDIIKWQDGIATITGFNISLWCHQKCLSSNIRICEAKWEGWLSQWANEWLEFVIVSQWDYWASMRVSEPVRTWFNGWLLARAKHIF